MHRETQQKNLQKSSLTWLFGRTVLEMTKLATVATLFLIPGKTVFAEVGEVHDFRIHQHFLSPRAMGMGNAFTAVADDYAAAFYNPAGLARLSEGEMNFELRGALDPDIIKFVSDVQKASDGQGNDVQEMQDLLSNNYGKHYGMRAPTLAWYWARPRWEIAIIPVDLSLDLEFHQNVGPAMSLVAYQDTTIAYARGWDVKWFEKDRMSLGVTLKTIYRGYFNKNVAAVDLVFDQKILRAEDASEGMTVDADFGMLYTPDPTHSRFSRAFRPSFGATVRSVADYGFGTNFHVINKESGKPPRDQRRLDLGSLFELPDLWIFKSRFAFDVRDIGHENWTFKKGSHAGFEFLWKVASWWQGGWRAGLNQGYLTLGFTGVFGIFQLDLTTYSEEVGPSDRPQSSRRYMAKASLDF